MFSTHCCSCEASNSAARKRRAVDPNAAIEASYQVVVDSNPPNVAPLNTSTITSLVQDGNQAVADEGVTVNGVKLNGTVVGEITTIKGNMSCLLSYPHLGIYEKMYTMYLRLKLFFIRNCIS